MPSKSLPKIFWTFTIITFAGLLLLNIYGSSWIGSLYTEGRFELLNKLTYTHGERSLDHYLGRAEDVLFGPLTNFLAHILFAIFSLLYLTKATHRQFIFGVFLFLLITKFPILPFPPYGDTIGGPFNEALWLIRHNFDYIGLYHELPYNEGGPRVYFSSIYPTYLAVLIKLIPHTKTFLVVNHLIVFFLASVVVGIFRKILIKLYQGSIPTLGSIFLLSLPLFQSQTEAINMEMPCLFFSMLAVNYLVEKDLIKASLFAILATFVKSHGIIVCGSVFFISWFLFFFDEKYRRKKQALVAAGIVVGGVLLKLVPKYFLKDQHITMIQPLAGLPSLMIMYLPVLFIGSLLVYGGFVVVDIIRKKDQQNFVNRHYLAIITFISATLWFAIFLNYNDVNPRYKLELAPFLVLGIMMAFLKMPKAEKIAPWILMIALGISSSAAFGRLHPRLGANYHVLSQRSLEYRNNVRLDMKLANFIESKFKGYTVGAPFIMAQMLAFPELGYVSSPLDVMTYGMPLKYGNFKNFNGLKNLNIRKTVWVGVAAEYFQKGDFTYPVHKRDQVVKDFILGDNKAVVFVGGFSIEQRFQMINQIKRLRSLSSL